MFSKKILILKTGEYNPVFNGLSKYESLNLITTYQYSPGIISPEKVGADLNKNTLLGIKIIVHSSLRRARETARVIKNLLEERPQVLTSNYLSEVKFSLKDLLTQNEYENEKSNLVRQRFIEGFIKNTLLETREEIFIRIKNLGQFLKKLEAGSNAKIICVSHSFFMKILQIYLIDDRLFDSPEILAKHFNPSQRTFEFCQGFEFNPRELL